MAITKTANLNKAQASVLLSDFFENFQTWCNGPTPPSTSDFEKFLSRNFRLTRNGKTVSKNLSDYSARIEKIRKKHSHFEIIGPIEELLISDNKIALHYEVDLTEHNGQKRLIEIMATATLEDGKFSEWIQVAREKDTDWDT